MATEHGLLRIGGPADGGYLVPDDLDGIAACFSPGVGDSVAFESDLLARGIPSHLADHTVDSPDPARFDFEPKRLAPRTGEDRISLEDWVALKRPGDDDLMLQMDIEGGEWSVLPAVPSETLRRFRIIVLELHRLGESGTPEGMARIRAALDPLLAGWVVVHLHPNNHTPLRDVHGIPMPKYLEVTLLRRDRVQHTAPVERLPHPLDAPNLRDRPDVVLPESWYRPGGRRSFSR